MFDKKFLAFLQAKFQQMSQFLHWGMFLNIDAQYIRRNIHTDYVLLCIFDVRYGPILTINVKIISLALGQPCDFATPGATAIHDYVIKWKHIPRYWPFVRQRPVTQSFDVYFDMHPNKRLSKQSWGWWFETPSRPLLRHCNVKKSWRIRVIRCMGR